MQLGFTIFFKFKFTKILLSLAKVMERQLMRKVEISTSLSLQVKKETSCSIVHIDVIY